MENQATSSGLWGVLPSPTLSPDHKRTRQLQQQVVIWEGSTGGCVYMCGVWLFCFALFVFLKEYEDTVGNMVIQARVQH